MRLGLAIITVSIMAVGTSSATLAAQCTVPRIAVEYSKIKDQRQQCQKNEGLPFCEDAENYEPSMTPTEASDAWDCLINRYIEREFANTSTPSMIAYKKWARFSKIPYASAHVNRFVDDTTEQAVYVMNFANEMAKSYGQYENSGPMQAGAVLAKYSMILNGDGGTLELAPVYTMQKIGQDQSPKTRGWRYDLLVPSAMKDSAKKSDLKFTQEVCASCHMEYGTKTDSMLFMPNEVRISDNSGS